MEAPILSFALKLSPFIGPFYFLCCSFAKQAKSCFPIANEQYLSFILANLPARVVSTLNKTHSHPGMACERVVHCTPMTMMMLMMMMMLMVGGAFLEMAKQNWSEELRATKPGNQRQWGR